VLKRKESGTTRKTDRAESSGDNPSPSEPAPSARPTVAPRVVQQGQYEAASLAIIRLICLAARQLLSLVGAVPKWTGIWLVLEAGDGTAAAPFVGKIIDCAAGETATAERGAFASDWWEFRGGKEGRRLRQRAQAAGDAGSDQKLGNPGVGGTTLAIGGKEGRQDGADQVKIDGDGDGGKQGGGDADASSADSASHPEFEMHTRSIVKTVVGDKMGSRTLTDDDLNKVLAMGGLESVNQITWDDIGYMYTKAAGVLRSRCASPSQFSWARACPLALLGNRWSSPSFAHSIDGSNLVPINHHGSKGVGIERKRLVMCVVAHLSPFYAHIFRSCFAAARASGKKRRTRTSDPFVDAKKISSRKRAKGGKPPAPTKQTKDENFAAAVKAAGAKAAAAAAAATKAVAARTAAAKAAAAKAAAVQATTTKAAAVKAAALQAAAVKAAAGKAAAVKAADVKAAAFQAAAVSAGVANASSTYPAPRHCARATAGNDPPGRTPRPGPAAVAAGAVAAGAAVGGGRGAIVPAAREPLCVLVRASEKTPMYQVWRRQPTPLLPSSTVLSVVPLSGPALSIAARESVSVRVVLPRHLLKDAFTALNKATGVISLSSEIAVDNSEQAVRLTVGEFDPVMVFSNTLTQMSSVISFNEAIVSSHKFLSWISGLATSGAYLPAPLDFWSRMTLPVGPLAEAVRGNVAGRRLGDCVWAIPRVNRSTAAAVPNEGGFGGCSVNVRDVMDAGQREYMTNALLDAGLAELQRRCADALTGTAVFSCTQSASFTSIDGEEVSLKRAVASILEVLHMWDTSVTRFVLLLNIDNTHWISASVSLTTGCVTVYDSAGGFCDAKRHIVSRLLLFARQAEVRWRAVHPDAAKKDIEWKWLEVNKPAQHDGYNCGLFAFAYIWCSVYGLDFESLPVDGDHMRLSFIYFVLMNGQARGARQVGDQRAARA